MLEGVEAVIDKAGRQHCWLLGCGFDVFVISTDTDYVFCWTTRSIATGFPV